MEWYCPLRIPPRIRIPPLFVPVLKQGGYSYQTAGRRPENLTIFPCKMMKKWWFSNRNRCIWAHRHNTRIPNGTYIRYIRSFSEGLPSLRWKRTLRPYFPKISPSTMSPRGPRFSQDTPFDIGLTILESQNSHGTLSLSNLQSKGARVTRLPL